MMFSPEYGGGGGPVHSLKPMAQDAMGADAWLVMGMRAQGPPSWFQAGLESAHAPTFLGKSSGLSDSAALSSEGHEGTRG